MTAMLRAVRRIMLDSGITKPLRFAAIHSDGAVLRCYRWSSDDRAPSLYWRPTKEGVVVASEPFDSMDWAAVAPGTMLTVGADGECRHARLDVEVL